HDRESSVAHPSPPEARAPAYRARGAARLPRVPILELADGVRSLPRESWNALVGDDSPFLEWDWLAGLEETGVVGAESGWLARPLVARDGDRLVAACPVYVKGNSEGEFV